MRLLLLTVGLLLCCTPETPPPGQTGTVCPPNSTLTLEGFGRPFMEKYCLRCHSVGLSGADRRGAPNNHDFDKVTDIRTLATHIDDETGAGPTGTNTQMPPDEPRPTLEERKRLSEWLACDAP